MKRCAAYMRCSTSMQENSIENQRMQIKAYAKANGMTIVREFDDPDRSGTNVEKREGFQAMKDFVEQNKGLIAAILVLDVTRWGRFEDADEGAYWEYHFKRMGILVIYVNEEFDNSPTMKDNIMKSLKRTMAGEYSRELSKKVLQGAKTVAGKGFSVGGTPPFGYDRLLVDSSGEPVRVLKPGEQKHEKNQRIIYTPADDEKVAVVRRIFHMYGNKSMGIRRILEILNAEMIPSPKGSKWTVGTISTMLKNTSYIGQIVYNRNANKRRKLGPGEIRKRLKNREEWVICENAHGPLVSKECFDKAQARFKNRKDHPSWDNSPYLLRDIMVCTRCGQGFSGHSKHNGSGRYYRYYVDAGFERYGSSYCQRTAVRKEKIENFVLEKLFMQLKEGDVVGKIRERLREAMSDYEEKATEEISLIDKEIIKINRELHNLIEFIKTCESQSCQDEITRLEARKAALESNKLVILHGPSPANRLEAEIDDIIFGLQNLKSMLRNGEFSQARKFINKVVPRIEVNPDDRIAKVFMLNLTEKAKGQYPENKAENGRHEKPEGPHKGSSGNVCGNMPKVGVEPTRAARPAGF